MRDISAALVTKIYFCERRYARARSNFVQHKTFWLYFSLNRHARVPFVCVVHAIFHCIRAAKKKKKKTFCRIVRVFVEQVKFCFLFFFLTRKTNGCSNTREQISICKGLQRLIKTHCWIFCSGIKSPKCLSIRWEEMKNYILLTIYCWARCWLHRLRSDRPCQTWHTQSCPLSSRPPALEGSTRSRLDIRPRVTSWPVPGGTCHLNTQWYFVTRVYQPSSRFSPVCARWNIIRMCIPRHNIIRFKT